MYSQTQSSSQSVVATGVRDFRVVQPLLAGGNVILHNLGLSTPPVLSSVLDDATGAIIDHRLALETTNSVSVVVTNPVASARITIHG